jgi:Domain of unknown function (DUF4440)
MDETTQELRDRREGLLAAVNAHDLEAVKRFIAPTFTARTASGWVLAEFDQMMEAGASTFRRFPDYRERLQIEEIVVNGDVAELTTERTESFTLLRWFPRQQKSRQVETWQRINGSWWMVEERITHGHPPERPAEAVPAPAPTGRGDEASPAE